MPSKRTPATPGRTQIVATSNYTASTQSGIPRLSCLHWVGAANEPRPNPILGPLSHISHDVVKAPLVGLLFAHRVGTPSMGLSPIRGNLISRITPMPSIVIQLFFRVFKAAKEIKAGRTSSAGVFPLGFCWEPVFPPFRQCASLLLFGSQFSAEKICLVPRNRVNWQAVASELTRVRVGVALELALAVIFTHDRLPLLLGDLIFLDPKAAGQRHRYRCFPRIDDRIIPSRSLAQKFLWRPHLKRARGAPRQLHAQGILLHSTCLPLRRRLITGIARGNCRT